MAKHYSQMWTLFVVACLAGVNACGEPPAEVPADVQLQKTRCAIQDLMATYGDRYPDGAKYLARLKTLRQRCEAGGTVTEPLEALRAVALRANPLLRNLRLAVVKRKYDPRRKIGQRWVPVNKYYEQLGMPSNHECNSSLAKTGWHDEIATFAPARTDSPLQTLYRPTDGGYVGELELNYDADRLLFTHSDATSWKIWEVGVDGDSLRRVSQLPDQVDCMDPMYLPDGRIIFGSTACYQSVPCWHGQKLVTNLFIMNADGTHVRRLCYDQDHNFHPTMLDNGQVLFNRWDYTGIVHIYVRELMVMNPDGTGQRAVYGSNTWFPNSLYFSRPLPGQSNRLITILSGYHGPHRMGQLVLLDVDEGWHGADGLVRRISGRGEKIQPLVRDNLVQNDWPKFLHPYPLSDKYFLVAAQLRRDADWGIYLADVFDNLLKLRCEPGWALLEPTPIKPRPRPPVIPDRIDPTRDDAVVYVSDVYQGRGLRGVPRGTVKRMRVIAYDFGYPGLAGPDKVGYGGPWEVMRILGTVRVAADGSALFRVPANTPIALQPLDQEGKAVQLMRSWYTAMPGESVSCVGCHETPHDAAPPAKYATALKREPERIQPWYGPPRGFDFQREVQPVLDRYCITCHSTDGGAKPDLRGLEAHPEYRGRRISDLGFKRLDPAMREQTDGVLKYTPAYEALLGYVRRVGIEDDASMLTPGELHADTSPLVQLLHKGHGGVTLDPESWDRLITWIDLNAPCHGTWSDVWAPIPNDAHALRAKLKQLTGGPSEDPELIPATRPLAGVKTTTGNRQVTTPSVPKLADWPFAPADAKQMQAAMPASRLVVPLDAEHTLKLVRIPAGQFVMGDPNGTPAEQPAAIVTIQRPFWMAACEISNSQYQCFDAAHDPRYYNKRHRLADDQGMLLNGPNQPVVRVSWREAKAFCDWLSQKTHRRFSLPTEAQWEWAARAGSGGDFCFGGNAVDPSSFANLAGREFGRGWVDGQRQVTGGVEHLVMDGAWLADRTFDDGAVVTEPVGTRTPNAWGLHDMLGNAAEWTRTTEASYPYRPDDGRNSGQPGSRKVVRGGSFFDPPRRAHSGQRLAYADWMRVFNVGFRVICEDDPDNVLVPRITIDDP